MQLRLTYDSSNETTQLILQSLLTLVSRPEGAKIFVQIEDLSPLIETAPSQPLVLDVFLHAYAHAATISEDNSSLQLKIDQTVKSLVASFKGTDAVTLLTFVDQLLRRLDREVGLPSALGYRAYTLTTARFYHQIHCG